MIFKPGFFFTNFYQPNVTLGQEGCHNYGQQYHPTLRWEWVLLWSLQLAVSDCALIGGCCRNMVTLPSPSLSCCFLYTTTESCPLGNRFGAFLGCTQIQDGCFKLSRVPMSNSLNNRVVPAMLCLFCNVSRMIVQIYLLLL